MSNTSHSKPLIDAIEDARAAVLNRGSLYADAWRRRRGADSDKAWERFRDEVDRLIAAVREETLCEQPCVSGSADEAEGACPPCAARARRKAG